MTALNVLTEKSTRQSRHRMSGNCTLKVLCIGVKCSSASAATPYWSRVLRVLVSQWFRTGHQSAWSDQSIAMSATNENNVEIKAGNGWITFLPSFQKTIFDSFQIDTSMLYAMLSNRNISPQLTANFRDDIMGFFLRKTWDSCRWKDMGCLRYRFCGKIMIYYSKNRNLSKAHG